VSPERVGILKGLARGKLGTEKIIKLTRKAAEQKINRNLKFSTMNALGIDA
jgi:hypothetical protein